MNGNEIVLMQVIPPVEYVYALRRRMDGRIKVGNTIDLEKRLRNLAGSHGDFDVIGIRYGTEADENVVRAALRPFRIPPKHDWFYASEEVFRYIQQNFAAHAEINGIRSSGGYYHLISNQLCSCGGGLMLLGHSGCLECIGHTLRNKRRKEKKAPIQYLSKFDYWQAQQTSEQEKAA